MIFDGHGDIWTDVTCRRLEHGDRDIFRNRHYEKFKKGGVTGGIFVIWMDPPYDADPQKRSKEVVESLKIELEDAKDILNLVTNYGDFARGDASQMINVVNGIEGLSMIGEDIDMLDYFYDEVGVRHCMLTWNETNPLATGWPGDVNRGLTEAGRQAVRRIQKLGMVMDVSHLNDKCFYDVISEATGPIIASHSNARAVASAMRNATDDMIKEIAKTGGLLGMNSLREFISDDKARQNVEGLADHAAYIADLVGTDYIGLGFDFDDYLDEEALSSFSGNTDSPSGDGIEDESKASDFLEALKKRGFTDEDIEKVAYKNFYRVFKESWK